MSVRKKQQAGPRRYAARTAGVVLCAALTGALPLAAQSPKLGGASTSTSAPLVKTEIPAPQMEEYVVKADEVIKDIVLTGELKAERSISITSPRIQSSFGNNLIYLAPEGAVVRAGERIVEFDDSSLLNSRVDAERTLDETELNIAKKKADLEATRTDNLNSVAQAEAAVKKAELYARIDKSLLAPNDYQKYQLDLQTSKLALDKAKEQLDNFEKSYDAQMALVQIQKSQAEINLKKIDSDMQLLKIDAPQDGIFIYGDNWQSNRKIQTGDNVFPGMEVAQIPDLTSMQVIGYVYDTEYRLLHPEMRCTVTLDALPQYTVGGEVVSLTSVASRRGFASEKKLFQAVIRLDKVDDSVLKPGMTARVNVPIVLAKGVLTVPREYIGVDSEGRDYVIKGDKQETADREFVQLGSVGDTMVEVTSGVSAGDKLLPVQYLAEVSR